MNRADQRCLPSADKRTLTQAKDKRTLTQAKSPKPVKQEDAVSASSSSPVYAEAKLTLDKVVAESGGQTVGVENGSISNGDKQQRGYETNGDDRDEGGHFQVQGGVANGESDYACNSNSSSCSSSSDWDEDDDSYDEEMWLHAKVVEKETDDEAEDLFDQSHIERRN